MGGFDDLGTVSKFRDVIRRLVVTEVNKLRPGYTYATVAEVDRDARLCRVLFPGETASVAIKLGSVVPTKIGQTVRVEGRLGDRYVADVMDDVTPLFLSGAGAASLPIPQGITLLPAVGALTALWVEADPSLSYDVELAQDETFSALIRKTRVAGTSFVAIGLLSQQDYYFRARCVDALGNQGDWSATAWIQTLTDAEATDIPDSGMSPMPEIPFSWSRLVDLSQAYTPPVDSRYVQSCGTLRTLGTTATTLTIYKNGAVFDTLVIPANETYETKTIDLTLRAGLDFVQAEPTTPGTGASGALLLLRKANK